MNNEAINGVKEIIKPITNLFNIGTKTGIAICITISIIIAIILIFKFIKKRKKNKNNLEHWNNQI